MLQLQFPIHLPGDVQIFNQTDDGFYIITYKNIEGNKCMIWLPESLSTPLSVDSNGCKTIEIVKKYLGEQHLNTEAQAIGNSEEVY